MNALITGITGQDGSYLTKLLLQKEYNVYGIISGIDGRDNFTNFDKLSISQENIKKVRLEDIEDMNLDGFEVYNLVGQSSVGGSWKIPEETFHVNLNRYVILLKALKNKKVKIFQASSGEMYGDYGDKPINENMSMLPSSPYALSKYSAYLYGKILREYEGYWITNGILFNHESKLRDDRFVIRKIINGVKEIQMGKRNYIDLGNLDIIRDWGFAEQYVEAMWRLLQLNSPYDVNIATGNSISLKELLKYIFSFYGIKDFEKYIRINLDLLRPNDTKIINVNTSKLNKLEIYLESVTEENIKRLI